MTGARMPMWNWRRRRILIYFDMPELMLEQVIAHPLWQKRQRFQWQWMCLPAAGLPL